MSKPVQGIIGGIGAGTEQRVGIPPQQRRTLEPRTRSRAALREPDALAVPDGDLTRSQAGEAHEPAPARVAEATAIGAGLDAQRAQRRHPRLAQPEKRPADVVVPQRVAGWDDDVDPEQVVGDHEHRATASAAAHELGP